MELSHESEVFYIEGSTMLNSQILYGIRWISQINSLGIVFYGGIDGYSSSTNNSAATVLSAFTSAVEEYGLPSRIRIDRG